MGSKIIKTNKQIVPYSIGNIALNNFLKLTTNKTNEATAKINPSVVASIHLKNKLCCSGILSTKAPLTLFNLKLRIKIKNSLKTFIYSFYRIKKEVLKKWWNILKARKRF